MRCVVEGQSIRQCRHSLLHLQIITPYNIYFNAWLILQKLELWRLFTNFFFFGSLGALCTETGPGNAMQECIVCAGLRERRVTQANLCAGLDFVFHMFFLVKYCKALEEGSFRSKSADFFWMLMFGELTCIAGPGPGCEAYTDTARKMGASSQPCMMRLRPWSMMQEARC